MANKAKRSYSETEDDFDVTDYEESVDLEYYERFDSRKSRSKKRKSVKHRLDDYFERKALKERNGYYDDFDYEYQ